MSLWPHAARGTPLGFAEQEVARYRSVQSLSLVDAAYIAGLVDGEGTITLSRRHAADKRQLVISISSTERPILDFALQQFGAGKITTKKTVKAHHSPGFTYAISNRQALSLLLQIEPFLRSYKRQRAALVRTDYVRLTPRNGKYTTVTLTARQRFESQLLGLRARSPAESGDTER
jgi:hypothetical protein